MTSKLIIIILKKNTRIILKSICKIWEVSSAKKRSCFNHSKTVTCTSEDFRIVIQVNDILLFHVLLNVHVHVIRGSHTNKAQPIISLYSSIHVLTIFKSLAFK